jgi:hypothetical protein
LRESAASMVALIAAISSASAPVAWAASIRADTLASISHTG